MNCGKNGVDIIDAKGLAYNFFRFVNWPHMGRLRRPPEEQRHGERQFRSPPRRIWPHYCVGRQVFLVHCPVRPRTISSKRSPQNWRNCLQALLALRSNEWFASALGKISFVMQCWITGVEHVPWRGWLYLRCSSC